MIVKRSTPTAIAITIGLITLLSLLFNSTTLANFLLGGAAFLAAVALLLGIVNLFLVHIYRLLRSGNPYSLLLLLSMIAIFILGWRDNIAGVTLDDAFQYVLAPLEAAFASMLAFFLLFAAIQLWQKQKNAWSALFLGTIIITLTLSLLPRLLPLPNNVQSLVNGAQAVINDILLISGVRGLLIGIAIGTILISLRLLVGLEQPYNK